MVGSADADGELAGVAEQVGACLAARGAVVVCGGLGGVMEAACRGARNGGATTIAILPGGDRREASPSVEIAIATGLGEARNALVARAADAMIAVGGEYGTLSEIALALKYGTPVVGIATWELSQGGRAAGEIVCVASAGDAVDRALALVEGSARR